MWGMHIGSAGNHAEKAQLHAMCPPCPLPPPEPSLPPRLSPVPACISLVPQSRVQLMEAEILDLKSKLEVSKLAGQREAAR